MALEFIVLPSGDRFTRIMWHEDPDRDEAWLEAERVKLSSTPSKFKLEILCDDREVEGALFKQEWLDKNRVYHLPDGIERRVISIDPSIADPEKARNRDKMPDECGIGVVSLEMRDGVPHFYVEQDWSGHYSPQQWATIVQKGYLKLKSIDKDVNEIVVEVNQGGEMVKETLQAYREGSIALYPPVRGVHSRIGKRARAEPVAAIAEQGQLHIVERHPKLERELTTWDSTKPGKMSPGRIDMLCQAVMALGGGVGVTQVETAGAAATVTRSARNRPQFEEVSESKFRYGL